MKENRAKRGRMQSSVKVKNRLASINNVFCIGLQDQSYNYISQFVWDKTATSHITREAHLITNVVQYSETIYNTPLE